MSSFIRADASKSTRIPREQLTEVAQVRRTVREYLADLEQQNPAEGWTHEQDRVSTTDPDATFYTKSEQPAELGYFNNYLVDSQSCVIVGVQATAARASQEIAAARDMIAQSATIRGRFPQRISARLRPNQLPYSVAQHLQKAVERPSILEIAHGDSWKT